MTKNPSQFGDRLAQRIGDQLPSRALTKPFFESTVGLTGGKRSRHGPDSAANRCSGHPLLMLRLHPLPAFQDNYIWTLSTPDGRALIVDPGDAAPVLAAADDGMQPVAILLTHHHPDHAGGVAELRRRFDIPCFAPHDERIADASHRVGDGDRVVIAALDLMFDVIALPGHTLSHIAFHGHGYLFCGDTLFSLGCGRMFEGSPRQMLASLDRLAALPDDTLVCCGHEYTQ